MDSETLCNLFGLFSSSSVDAVPANGDGYIVIRFDLGNLVESVNLFVRHLMEKFVSNKMEWLFEKSIVCYATARGREG